jgi:hypothetical protein
LEEDKYLSLLNRLTQFHKTTGQIAETNYKGFAIVKGSVSDIEGNSFFTFDIVDNPDNWDAESSLTGSLKEVPFVSGSEDLIFIGDVYKKTNKPGFAMNIQKVIVPEQFKKKDLPKENSDIIEQSFDNDLSSNSNIDEELL